MIRYLLLLCAAAVLFWGCVKDREEEFASQETERETEGEAGRRPKSDESSRKEGRLLMEMERTESREEKEAALLTRLESGQRTLLALPRGEGILPRDTEIGELQGTFRYDEPGEERVYTVLDEFLSGLTEGRVETDLLDEEWRWLLKRSLEDLLEEGAIPRRYRLGEIQIEKGTARANVRLLSARGRCSGELFLSLSDPEKGWKITDFQADLYELLEDYNVTGRFEPKMYDMTDLF